MLASENLAAKPTRGDKAGRGSKDESGTVYRDHEEEEEEDSEEELSWLRSSSNVFAFCVAAVHALSPCEVTRGCDHPLMSLLSVSLPCMPCHLVKSQKRSGRRTARPMLAPMAGFGAGLPPSQQPRMGNAIFVATASLDQCAATVACPEVAASWALMLTSPRMLALALALALGQY